MLLAAGLKPVFVDFRDFHLINDFFNDGSAGVQHIEMSVQKDEPEMEAARNINETEVVFFSFVVGPFL